MLRRLLTALLALCLAVPAMTLPLTHDHAMPDHLAQLDSGKHHHGDRHQPARHDPAQHQCIGCIAPVSPVRWRPATVQLPAPRAIPALAASLHAHVVSPEPPPPRS